MADWLPSGVSPVAPALAAALLGSQELCFCLTGRTHGSVAQGLCTGQSHWLRGACAQEAVGEKPPGECPQPEPLSQTLQVFCRVPL